MCVYMCMCVFMYIHIYIHIHIHGVPSGSDVKESAYNAGDPGSIPESGRSPGEGYGIPLQYSCLDNPMDRGDWRAAVTEVSKSQKGLSG